MIPLIVFADAVCNVYDDVFTDAGVISWVQVLLIYLLFDRYILLRFDPDFFVRRRGPNAVLFIIKFTIYASSRQDVDER